MNKKLHPHTISLLQQLVWRKPGQNVITHFLQMERESGNLPSGKDFIQLLNDMLLSINFTRYGRYQHKPDIKPIRVLEKKMADVLSISFKNIYQFAAFLLLADSHCSPEETDQIESVLNQLKPDYLHIEKSLDLNEEEEDYVVMPDNETDIMVIFECAPDHILRCEPMLQYERFEKLFQLQNYFEEGTKVVAYFMDDPFDRIPKVVLKSYFSAGMIHHLIKTYPDHPFPAEWIRWTLFNGHYNKLQYHSFLSLLPEKDRQNKETILRFAAANGLELEHAAPYLRQDEEIVKAAVAQNGCALEFADPAFQRDVEIVRTAIESNPKALLTLIHPVSFSRDTFAELIQSALERKSNLVKDLPKNIFEVFPEVLDILVTKDPSLIRFGSENYRSSKELAKKILLKKPLALEYFHASIQDDKELVSQAVQNNGLALQFASTRLQSDEQIITLALEQDKKSFVFIGKQVRPSKEIALKWLQLQPLIALHLNLFQQFGFDALLLKIYSIGIMNMKNQDILSIPSSNNPGYKQEEVDLEDFF